MNKAICFIVIGLIMMSCRSRLKCCETIDDISNTLSGLWKHSVANSNELHAYSFNQKLGHLTDMVPTENTREYLIIDDHTRVEIIKKGRHFELSFMDLSSSWKSNIIYLDSKTLVLETDGKENTFIKIKASY